MPNPYGVVLALALCCGFGNRRFSKKIKHTGRLKLELDSMGSLVDRADRSVSHNARPMIFESEEESLVAKEREELSARIQANVNLLRMSGCAIMNENMSAKNITADVLRDAARDSTLLQDLMQTDIFKLLQFRDVAPKEFLKSFDDSFSGSESKRAHRNVIAAIPGTVLSIAGLNAELIAQGLEPGVKFSESATHLVSTVHSCVSNTWTQASTLAQVYEWHAQALRNEREELKQNKATTPTEYFLDAPVGYLWEAYRNAKNKDKGSQVFGRPIVNCNTQTWESPRHFKERRKPKELKGGEQPIFVTWKGERHDEGDLQKNLVKVYFSEPMDSPYFSKNALKEPWQFDDPRDGKSDWKSAFFSERRRRSEETRGEHAHGNANRDERNRKEKWAWVKEDHLHSQAWFRYNPPRSDQLADTWGATHGGIYTCCRHVKRISAFRKQSRGYERELWELRNTPFQNYTPDQIRHRNKWYELNRHAEPSRFSVGAIQNQCREFDFKFARSPVTGKFAALRITDFKQLVEPGDVLMFNGARVLDHERTIYEWELADGRGCMRVPRELMEGPLGKEDLQKDPGQFWVARDGTYMAGENMNRLEAAYNGRAVFASRYAFHLGMGIAGFFTAGVTWGIQGGVGFVDSAVGAGLRIEGSRFKSDAFALFMDSLYDREHRLFTRFQQSQAEFKQAKFCSLMRPEKKKFLLEVRIKIEENENQIVVENFPGTPGTGERVSPCPDEVLPSEDVSLPQYLSLPQYCLRSGAFVPGLPFRMQRKGIFETIKETLLAKIKKKFSRDEWQSELTKHYVVENASMLPKGDGKFGVLGVCVPRLRVASALHQVCIVDADCLSDYCHLSFAHIGGSCEQPCLPSTASNTGCMEISRQHKFGYCQLGGDEPGVYELIADLVVTTGRERYTKDKTNEVVKLLKGSPVNVIQVSTVHHEEAKKIRVRGQIENPSGWISLFDPSRCRRYARRAWGNGDMVEANQEFTTDNEKGFRILKSTSGKIIEIDKAGDAYIKFEAHDDHAWVFNSRLQLLSKPASKYKVILEEAFIVTATHSLASDRIRTLSKDDVVEVLEADMRNVDGAMRAPIRPSGWISLHREDGEISWVEKVEPSMLSSMGAYVASFFK